MEFEVPDFQTAGTAVNLSTWTWATLRERGEQGLEMLILILTYTLQIKKKKKSRSIRPKGLLQPLK